MLHEIDVNFKKFQVPMYMYNVSVYCVSFLSYYGNCAASLI